MRYYKIVTDNLLSVIGVGNGGVEITEAEYHHLKTIIDNIPKAPTGYGYRLTVELEWELYELPPIMEDEIINEVPIYE